MANYQIAGEDDHKFTIEHPNGEKFEVAKSQLTPEFIDQIKSMPIKSTEDEKPIPQPTPEQTQEYVRQSYGDQPVNSDQQVQENVPASAEQEATQAAQPTTVPQDQQISLKPQTQNQTPPLLNQFQENIGLQEKGIQGGAQAQVEKAQAEQKDYAQAVGKMQAIVDKNRAQQDTLMQETQNLSKDVAQSKVDPNRYWNNKSTLGKIGASVALILGGIGQGLQRTTSNAALEVMNREIQNDIESQRADLGKKQTLLSQNLQKYGNLNAATHATVLQMNAVLQGQIAAAAAKSGSTQAIANSQIALGQLKNQALGQNYQMYQQQMGLDMLQHPDAQNIDASMKVRFLVPEREQPAAYKEVQVAQNMQKGKDNLLNAFDQVSQKRTVLNRIASPLQNERQVEALIGPLTAQLSKDSAGKFTEQDAKMIEHFWPSYGDNAETLKLKKDQLNKFVSEKMHFPLLDAYGVKPNLNSIYNAQGQKKIQESAPQI